MNTTIPAGGPARRRHVRERMSSPVAYDPAACAPTWDWLLRTTFGDDPALIEQVHRAVGYSMTGVIDTPVLFVLRGSRDHRPEHVPGTVNKASVFLHALRLMLGSYCATARGVSVITEEETLRLAHHRVVIHDDLAPGQVLDMDKIRRRARGGRLVLPGRHIEQCVVVPRFVVWVSTRYGAPIVPQAPAALRHVRVFPVSDRPLADPDILGTLAMELPGILAWGVEGAGAYYREGFRPKVRARPRHPRRPERKGDDQSIHGAVHLSRYAPRYGDER